MSNSQNAPLAKLDASSREALQLTPTEFVVDQRIYEAGQPPEWVYFPDCGVISVVEVFHDGSMVEVETIGRESIVGSFLLLGAESIPFRAFVQVAGTGFKTTAARFLKAASTDSAIRATGLEAEYALRVQSMQNSACNVMHSIEQRCCRWLLMARDRVDSNDLKLTHEFLAMMLGVRRASVSEVIRPLHDAGVVRGGRGVISILDRSALARMACECYVRIAANED
ncbi:Crp/Fnr family transcriptional regulator [Lacipirellula sp.]|uniref:Crp/Fnr family transcriptional regulator n=1 Tax=Lacipirellula sp. TaxID=2691419 RepID=UPI003D0C3A01